MPGIEKFVREEPKEYPGAVLNRLMVFARCIILSLAATLSHDDRPSPNGASGDAPARVSTDVDHAVTGRVVPATHHEYVDPIVNSGIVDNLLRLYYHTNINRANSIREECFRTKAAIINSCPKPFSLALERHCSELLQNYSGNLDRLFIKTSDGDCESHLRSCLSQLQVILNTINNNPDPNKLTDSLKKLHVDLEERKSPG